MYIKVKDIHIILSLIFCIFLALFFYSFIVILAEMIYIVTSSFPKNRDIQDYYKNVIKNHVGIYDNAYDNTCYKDAKMQQAIQ